MTPSTDFSTAKPQSGPWANRAAPHDILSAAIGYGRKGWAVIPVNSLTKIPMFEGWRSDWSKDEDQIRAWWKQWPNAMVGIVTGEASGVWVLDVDIDDEKGIDGRPVLDDWQRRNGYLPATPSAITPRGGRHIWFAWHEGVRNKSGRKEMRGVDWRGEGGFIVAAPSTRSDGKAYRWEGFSDDEPPADAPAWLLDIVLKKPSISERAQAAITPRNGPWSPARGYGAAALDAECSELAATGSGGRNEQLNRAAFCLAQLVAGGELGEHEVKSALFEAAGACGLIQDDGRQSVEKTIWSGFNAGLGHPRKAPERPQSGHWGLSSALAGGSEKAAGGNPAAPAVAINASPFVWRDPAGMPRRQWLMGRTYARRYVSATVAPGGVGKSSLFVVEALSMATGRDLLGDRPYERVNVWYFNAEDPLEETERRVLAAMLHFDIKPEEVEGRLFLDSGRDMPIKLATMARDGAVIAKPVSDALIATMSEMKIGVLLVDPFVSTHSVSENDNNAIDLVAKEWGRIAEKTNAAIGLAHHSRKLGGETVTTETSRGASALMDAARIGRALNRMTKTQGEELGVETPSSFFRIGGADSPGKHNLAPPADKTEWYQLVSVPLGNGHDAGNPFGNVGGNAEGDHVAVVDRWEPTKLLDHVETVAQLEEIQRNATSGRWRHSQQAQGEPWIGKLIADVLGDCDLAKEGHRKRVRKLLNLWIETKALEIYEAKDSHGEVKKYVRGGPGE